MTQGKIDVWEDKVRSKSRVKQTDDLKEFAGGFAIIKKEEIQLILELVRDRIATKAHLRVWSGIKESHVLFQLPKPKEICFSVIVNSSKRRRLTKLQLRTACSDLTDLNPYLCLDNDKIAPPYCLVPRKFLRFIASGNASRSEVCVLLLYTLKRRKQTKRLEVLQPGQRYCRFAYRELQELTNITRANICKATKQVLAQGLITRVTGVPQQNINRYGGCYVDGSQIDAVANEKPGLFEIDDPVFENTSGPSTTDLEIFDELL